MALFPGCFVALLAGWPLLVSAGSGQILLLELEVNGSNTVGLKAPDLVPLDIIWTLPSTDGTAGQVLSTNGAGVLNWTSAGGGGGGFANGGNSFGANATLGTNDNYSLSLKTNNSVAMSISNNGNVGIGVTSPSAKLDVQGQVVSREIIVTSGSTVDFSLGNSQILQSVGSTTITLNNMVNGGQYTLIIEDLTARTYTFNNCTTTRAVPALAETTGRSVFTILKASTACYITWITGF